MANQKVALITGANRGIGFETAKQLGEKNISVILGARKLSDAENAADRLKAQGIDAYGIQLDVTKANERTAAYNLINERFGKLDILINNAGAAPKDMLGKPVISETSAEDFETVFQINLFSVVYLTNTLIPLLKKSESGRIVNLSSIVGSLTLQSMDNSPLAGFRNLAYNASKTSTNMYTVLLAEELRGTKIKVNAAHPGWVKTEMGTENAQLEIPEGAKTSVELALIGEEGPTGKFIHAGENLPW